MKFSDAICSVCQRMIRDGSFSSQDILNGENIMVQHPSSSVKIDVTKKGWQDQFESNHELCDGSAMTPQFVVGDDLHNDEVLYRGM